MLHRIQSVNLSSNGLYYLKFLKLLVPQSTNGLCREILIGLICLNMRGNMYKIL